MENQERKAYLTIGSVRTLDIRVIFEDTEIFMRVQRKMLRKKSKD